jgi:serine/threonine-protein kinase
MQCPSCAGTVPDRSKFCPTCGQALETASALATVAAPPGAVAVAGPNVRRLASSDTVPVGGFTPGLVLADRYRIIGLLGRGGMGEVYRADDLKLGQPVALKFLPRALAEDPVRRERFFAEVRITRQLSHPNICRVYDIAEVNGQHFLSMEFIDGEDLASLLQRIGYLANEKALDITRQLVAGVAAAHERGVLHRDLKPANVMIDGRGRVRITDFGLAVAATDEVQASEMSGTPTYMAPEQLAGKGATVRSDIYALGLVLYELYTGKRAFAAPTLAELRDQKESLTPPAPSELRPGIDPAVERVIARCLERDPRQRPASAAQLTASLPGGDPLAAAIAAGETPSPEMVAAGSGTAVGMHPAVAAGLLLLIAVASVAAVLLSERTSLWSRVDPSKPPAALVERIQEHIAKAGYPAQPLGSAQGFRFEQAAVDAALDKGADATVAPLGIRFWYRQSPAANPRSTPAIGLESPPLYFAGEVAVEVDVEGRLRWLTGIPPQRRETAEPRAPDWSAMFESAGLDMSKWTSVVPEWNPVTYADTQVAWTGVLPEAPDVPARIEAAAYQGQVVSFRVMHPWSASERTPSETADSAVPLLPFGLPALCVGALLLARRNIRLGRGDRRGALRLGVTVFAAVWVMRAARRLGAPVAPEVMVMELGFAVLVGAIVWVAYMAIEPFVRRRNPQLLVSWTRLLAAEWRDPLVGRDVLIGCAAGAVAGIFHPLGEVLSRWLGGPDVAYEPPLWALDGVGGLFFAILLPVTLGTAVVFILLLLSVFALMVLRRAWLAYVMVLAVVPLILATEPDAVVLLVAGVVGYFMLPLIVLTRFGLLAGLTTTLVTGFFFNPLTFRSVWYAHVTYIALFLVAAIALYGFKTALGGRRVIEFPDA